MKISCPALGREEVASEKNIAEIVAALDGCCDDGFAILERDDQHYMQIAWSEAGFDLEYQEGSLKQHYRATMPLRAVDTVWALRCYLQGRPDWQQRLHFERMAWAPERPKRGPVVPISWWQVLKSLFFPPR